MSNYNIIYERVDTICAVGRRPIIGHTAPCNIYTPVHISYYLILLLMYYIVQIYHLYVYVSVYICCE